jgi:F-box and leucine-rich repeat protein 14
MTQLKHLGIRWTLVSEAGAAGIASLYQLEYLDLRWCPDITDIGVAWVATMTKLQHLYLGDCWRISNDAARSIASLTQLAYLAINKTDITDDGIVSLAALTHF